MQNKIIPNGSKVDTYLGVFEVLEFDIENDEYFCYQQNFDGHSGVETIHQKCINSKYENSCWFFKTDEVSLIGDVK